MKFTVIPAGTSLEGTIEELRAYLMACPLEARAVLFSGSYVLLSKASLDQLGEMLSSALTR